jgi:hypothetical protein
MAGTHLILFVIQDLPVPRPNQVELLRDLISNLAMPDEIFAPYWLPGRRTLPWQSRWAVSGAERLRVRVIVESVLAAIYGITADDFRRITLDCDHPVESLADKSKTRSFDTKGFWRVDRDVPPELRFTVLAQIAFENLLNIGLEKFVSQNDGEGWMLPDSLRLADYGLGHDDRAKEHQPVAARLGPRFYSWQLEQSVEESWEECERHAEILNQLLPHKRDESAETDEEEDGPKDLFGDPIPTNLFGEPVPSRKKR